ncbi:hypothetical protein HOY82DRAFT_37402 [Tuber indicum]|nr:hypothetical protein HOY82DRAFT_37402 [Tuber indicum]
MDLLPCCCSARTGASISTTGTRALYRYVLVPPIQKSGGGKLKLVKAILRFVGLCFVRWVVEAETLKGWNIFSRRLFVVYGMLIMVMIS